MSMTHENCEWQRLYHPENIFQVQTSSELTEALKNIEHH